VKMNYVLKLTGLAKSGALRRVVIVPLSAFSIRAHVPHGRAIGLGIVSVQLRQCADSIARVSLDYLGGEAIDRGGRETLDRGHEAENKPSRNRIHCDLISSIG
jgi:hypothetical protein